MLKRYGLLLLAGLLLGCNTRQPTASTMPFLMAPDSPEMTRKAPAVFDVKLETTKGLIVIQCHRDWAPRGADRFYNLARMGYYDQVRFTRVVAGKWAQFGINGDPQISQLWRTQTIADDPRTQTNARGTVAFAFAVPNGRTTQVFFNLKDNAATHDAPTDGVPFAPFGKVTEGMEVADALNTEYGENAGGGIRGGKQGPLFEQGNAYLEKEFPRLDYIVKATVIEESGPPATHPATTHRARLTDQPRK